MSDDVCIHRAPGTCCPEGEGMNALKSILKENGWVAA